MPSPKRSPTKPAPAADPAAVEAQLDGFIGKFEPAVAALIRACRAEARRLLPTAFELVYDNYNFFVIGYASTERASDCIVSLAAAANGVGLSFYNGASLPDPAGLLQGSGKQNRFIRLPAAERLRDPEVVRLVSAAAALGRHPLPPAGSAKTLVKSVSARQRPRRAARPQA